jgi:hypothetical protein
MKATFGTTIRAARMGYHAVQGVGFVRILTGGPPWEIDILPFDDVRVQKGKTEHHVWWDTEESRRRVEWMIRQHVPSEVVNPRVLFLDDDAKLLDDDGELAVRESR